MSTAKYRFIEEEFPPAWETEISSLPGSQRRSVRRLASVVHTAGVLGRHVNVGRHRARKRTDLERISLYYLAHSTQLGEAIYRLVAFGYGPAAFMLVRSLVEADIDLAYLWLSKRINGPRADDREAWMAFEVVVRDKAARMWEEAQAKRVDYGLDRLAPLFSEEKLTNYKALAKAFRLRFQRDSWARIPALDARARKVDESGELRRLTGQTLEDDYSACYRMTSELVHGTSAGANAYIDASDQVWKYNPQPGEPYITMSSNMAGRFLLDIVCMSNHINRLEVDITAQLSASGFSTVGEHP